MGNCRLPITYWAVYNPPTQGNRRKNRRNYYHQDKDALRSGVSHIQYLRVECPDNQKWQTRRVPPDDEGLQDWHWRNGNYFRDWKIQFLRTIIHRGALREFYVIAGQVGSTNNTHLKKIKEGLLSYFFPLNAPNKYNSAMRHDISKSQDLQLKILAAQII